MTKHMWFVGAVCKLSNQNLKWRLIVLQALSASRSTLSLAEGYTFILSSRRMFRFPQTGVHPVESTGIKESFETFQSTKLSVMNLFSVIVASRKRIIINFKFFSCSLSLSLSLSLYACPRASRFLQSNGHMLRFLIDFLPKSSFCHDAVKMFPGISLSF